MVAFESKNFVEISNDGVWEAGQVGEEEKKYI